jgi:hypothetical protein
LSGDIRGPLLEVVAAVEPPAGAVESSDQVAPAGPKPIGCDDVGLGAVSDLMASSAADAAPRASSMKEP